MTRIIGTEQCPFVVYTTYLMLSKLPSPSSNFSCSCTSCLLYCS